jgi:hypothetical protein
MQQDTFSGDAEYCYNCTGDCVVGDNVRFSRAKFTGSFRNAKFAGYELVTAVIIKDSYGRDKGQHTFTLQLPDGSTTRIKGRNLYANSVYRLKWDDECARDNVAGEKHARGDAARAMRDIQKNMCDF